MRVAYLASHRTPPYTSSATAGLSGTPYALCPVNSISAHDKVILHIFAFHILRGPIAGKKGRRGEERRLVTTTPRVGGESERATQRQGRLSRTLHTHRPQTHVDIYLARSSALLRKNPAGCQTPTSVPTDDEHVTAVCGFRCGRQGQ